MGKSKTLLAVLLVTALAALFAGGCQRGGGGQEGGGGGGTRIGLSISTLNNPFFVTLRDGAQSAANEANAELIIADAQNDASKQQNDLQNFVTQQVDAILVNPVDSEAIVPAIEAANGADIPVIALDRGAEGGEIATTIASDNVQGGRLAGEELIRLVESGPVAQQPDRIGSLGVENAMKVIDGESIPESIPVEVKLVTRENVSEFMQ